MFGPQAWRYGAVLRLDLSRVASIAFSDGTNTGFWATEFSARTKFYVAFLVHFFRTPPTHLFMGIPVARGLCLLIMSSKYFRAADICSSFMFCNNLRFPRSKSSFVNFPSDCCTNLRTSFGNLCGFCRTCLFVGIKGL